MIGDTTCPSCGRINERYDAADPGVQPKPGDVSICWGCGHLGFFTDDGGVRAPTLEEAAALEGNPEVRRVQAAIRESYTPAQAIKLRRGGAQ